MSLINVDKIGNRAGINQTLDTIKAHLDKKNHKPYNVFDRKTQIIENSAENSANGGMSRKKRSIVMDKDGGADLKSGILPTVNGRLGPRDLKTKSSEISVDHNLEGVSECSGLEEKENYVKKKYFIAPSGTKSLNSSKRSNYSRGTKKTIEDVKLPSPARVKQAPTKTPVLMNHKERVRKRNTMYYIVCLIIRIQNGDDLNQSSRKTDDRQPRSSVMSVGKILVREMAKEKKTDKKILVRPNVVISGGQTITKREIIYLSDFFDKLSTFLFSGPLKFFFLGNNDNFITLASFSKAFSDKDYMRRVTISLFNFLDKDGGGKVTFQQML